MAKMLLSGNTRRAKMQHEVKFHIKTRLGESLRTVPMFETVVMLSGDVRLSYKTRWIVSDDISLLVEEVQNKLHRVFPNEIFVCGTPTKEGGKIWWNILSSGGKKIKVEVMY